MNVGRASEHLKLYENSNNDKMMRALDKLSDGSPSKEHIQSIADKFKMEFDTIRKMWAKHKKDKS